MTMTPVCSCSTRCCSLLRWSRLLDLAPPEAFNIWHWGPYISFHETRFRPTLRWESSPILADAYHTHLDHDSDPYVSRTTTTTWLLLNFVLPKKRRTLISGSTILFWWNFAPLLPTLNKNYGGTFQTQLQNQINATWFFQNITRLIILYVFVSFFRTWISKGRVQTTWSEFWAILFPPPSLSETFSYKKLLWRD